MFFFVPNSLILKYVLGTLIFFSLQKWCKSSLLRSFFMTNDELFNSCPSDYGFKMEELMEICSQEKYLENKREGMEDLRDALIEKLNVKYFFINHM